MHMISVCPVEVVPETDEEKLLGFETSLLQDLSELKHRQVIHPVLQEGQFKYSHIGIPIQNNLLYVFFPQVTYSFLNLCSSGVEVELCRSNPVH